MLHLLLTCLGSMSLDLPQEKLEKEIRWCLVPDSMQYVHRLIKYPFTRPTGFHNHLARSLYDVPISIK